MYKKLKLSFKNKDVFDSKFKPNLDTCFCIVSKLLLSGVINPDGSIQMEKAVSLKKHELWSYIYYLFYYNNKTIPEFIKMKIVRTEKASAVLFYESVQDATNSKVNSRDTMPALDINVLVYFINKMIHQYEDNLINPVIDTLKQIIKKEIIPNFGSFSIKTGNSGENVKILTNPEDIKNANVKVRFGMK